MHRCDSNGMAGSHGVGTLRWMDRCERNGQAWQVWNGNGRRSRAGRIQRQEPIRFETGDATGTSRTNRRESTGPTEWQERLRSTRGERVATCEWKERQESNESTETAEPTGPTDRRLVAGCRGFDWNEATESRDWNGRRRSEAAETTEADPNR